MYHLPTSRKAIAFQTEFSLQLLACNEEYCKMLNIPFFLEKNEDLENNDSDNCDEYNNCDEYYECDEYTCCNEYYGYYFYDEYDDFGFDISILYPYFKRCQKYIQKSNARNRKKKLKSSVHKHIRNSPKKKISLATIQRDFCKSENYN